MKKIGLIGGLGPDSTVEYYLNLVKLCQKNLGEDVYTRIVIDSVDMGIHTEYFNRQDYQTIGDFIYESFISLKNAGAELEAGLSPVVPSKEDQIILGKLFLSWLIKNYVFFNFVYFAP